MYNLNAFSIYCTCLHSLFTVWEWLLIPSHDIIILIFDDRSWRVNSMILPGSLIFIPI